MRAPSLFGPSAAAALLLIACADDAQQLGEGGAGGGVLTGAGGAPEVAAGPSTDASSTAATVATSTTGAGGSGLGAPYPIVLAHGFFGFEEFAGLDFATYFYQVKEDLADSGEVVFTPAVDPFNDSTFRGAQLVAAIEGVLAETGAEKVVIIGHSQGGLDARVVAHDRPELVAAVVTVATPHQGTPVADVLLGLIQDDRAADLLDELVGWVGGALYDQVGDETSIAAPLRLFSQEGIAAFNAAYPDAPGVFYASLGGRTAGAPSGGDCSPDVDLELIARHRDDRDAVDPLLAVAEAIVSGFPDDVVNDGLVRVRDAKRGEFWGCVPADHLDEIGHLFGDAPGSPLGSQNGFRHRPFYRDLIAAIRARGF